jgi:guanosine-3',5'-bis(diphosphate) 3'-pyrophosphohydrolase
MQKALEFAVKKHAGQMRKGFNAPYIVHCLEVVKELALFEIDDTSPLYEVGFLHDTLEDTETTYEELVSEFGFVVANMVRDLSFSPDSNQTKQQYMDSFADKEIELVVVKLADRMCNVRDFLETRWCSQDVSYAVKYFDKAKALFACLSNRKDEIIKAFSQETLLSIAFRYGELREMIEEVRERGNRIEEIIETMRQAGWDV